MEDHPTWTPAHVHSIRVIPNAVRQRRSEYCSALLRLHHAGIAAREHVQSDLEPLRCALKVSEILCSTIKFCVVDDSGQMLPEKVLVRSVVHSSTEGGPDTRSGILMASLAFPRKESHSRRTGHGTLRKTPPCPSADVGQLSSEGIRRILQIVSRKDCRCPRPVK